MKFNLVLFLFHITLQKVKITFLHNSITPATCMSLRNYISCMDGSKEQCTYLRQVIAHKVTGNCTNLAPTINKRTYVSVLSNSAVTNNN